MRIYFLGVAGTAMGNAALLLRDLGHDVIGSDQAVYPPMSDMLVQAGVEVLEGYSADRLQELDPDLVVIGNAFSRGNEEVEFLLESRSFPFFPPRRFESVRAFEASKYSCDGYAWKDDDDFLDRILA